MSESASRSSNNVSFIIQNISKKKIRIFNYPLLPGQQRDLMKIPGIGEEDVRSSLLKGQLQFMISVGQITVVQSDIDLIQFNTAQQIFLQNAGISAASTDIGADLGLPTSAQKASYAAVTDWYFDPSASINNSGTDSAHPIPPSEWTRRTAGIDLTVAGLITLHYLIGDPNHDLIIACNVPDGTQMLVSGTAAVVSAGLTGTMTTYRAQDPLSGTGTPFGITDTTAPASWPTTYLGKRLRCTSGTGVGGIAWIEKQESAQLARISAPYNAGTIGFGYQSNTALIAFATNDTYIVENLPIIGGLRITGYLAENFTTAVVFVDLAFPQVDGFKPTLSGGSGQTAFVNCFVPYIETGEAGISFVGCRSMFVNCQGGGQPVFYGCAFDNFGVSIYNGSWAFFDDCLFQGVTLLVDANSKCDLSGTTGSGCGIFDVGVIGLQIQRGSTVRSKKALYGSGQTIGVAVYDMSRFLWDIIPIIGGGSVAYQVDSTNAASWGTATYCDALTGSSVGQINIGGGPNTRIAKVSWSCSALAVTTATAQCLPEGYISVALQAASDTIGKVVAAVDRINTITFIHTGSASNIAGQTMGYVLKKNGTAITGATCTVAANISTAVTANFTAVALAVGDKLTLIATPSATLTVGVIDIMGSVSFQP